MKKQPALVLDRLAARVSASLDHIILPFDFRDFAACIEALDYQLPRALPPEPSVGPPSMTMSAAGPVAQKGEFIVDINHEKQFVGVSGGDPPSLCVELDEIIAEMESKGFVSREKIRYHEFQGRYRALTHKGLDSMKRLGKDSAIVRKGGKALGRDVGLFSVRLVGEESEADSPDYFEVFVEPTITKPEHELGVSTVYRTKDIKAFQEFVSLIEKRILTLLKEYLKP